VIDAQQIVFGQNPNQSDHAFRYIDAMALERREVIAAILADLQSNLPLAFPAPNNAPFIGRVIVNGLALRYHAYPVSEGLVNVGAITRA
jgi:hypothetical protein